MPHKRSYPSCLIQVTRFGQRPCVLSPTRSPMASTFFHGLSRRNTLLFYAQSGGSHPARVRGLKLEIDRLFDTSVVSHPARVRGLKLAEMTKVRLINLRESFWGHNTYPVLRLGFGTGFCFRRLRLRFLSSPSISSHHPEVCLDKQLYITVMILCICLPFKGKGLSLNL